MFDMTIAHSLDLSTMGYTIGTQINHWLYVAVPLTRHRGEPIAYHIPGCPAVVTCIKEMRGEITTQHCCGCACARARAAGGS